MDHTRPCRQSLTFVPALLAACLFATSFSIAHADDPVVTGWRGDGTGRFAAAQPPREWSAESPNVVWKTELPRGYSSPVLCDGRLFVTAEPSQVICLDANTGKELWQKSAGYELALGKDKAAEIAARQATLETARQEINKQYKDLREARPDAPELKALEEKRKAADEELREFEREYPPEKRGGAGNAAATVLCDGKRIYAVFGTGVIAAFDLAGEFVWARHFEAPQQGFGHSASPVLADGRLIVHIEQLSALDPETGRTVWQAEVPAKFGTPAVVHVANQDVIITPAGDVVKADDGSTLARKLFQLSNNSPLIHDDVLYAHEGGKIKAFRLPGSLDTPFEPTALWETDGARDQRMASAVYHDGLLYAGGRKGIIEVTDAATGKIVYKKRLDIGELFASPVLAGNLIYFSGKDGGIAVLQPGREFYTVAINQLQRVSSNPVFADRRMYIRTDRALYCIEAESSP